MSVYDDTEAAVAAAGHLTDMDKGAVAALLVLAEKIDTLAAASRENVLLPTFLRYCDALGLTPAGRKVLADKKQADAKPNSLAERRAKHLRTA